ncbi:MAG: FmdB family zinc ribbon protein [Fidelibacterota bacterium]
MPMYDYLCVSCGRKFEELVSSFSNSDSEIVCPYRKKMNSKRMVCAPALSKYGSSK